MNLTQIQDLIKFVAKSGISEVEIEQKDFKITIKTESQIKKREFAEPVYLPAPPSSAALVQATQVPVASALTAPPSAPVSEGKAVNSPMIGTFYRSKSPDKPPLVQVGDSVKKGTVLCIIEAMKLFNEIEAEFDGKIIKVLADDSQPVEYDQPLFLIDPA